VVSVPQPASEGASFPHHPRVLAYMGDAIYGLWIREQLITRLTSTSLKELHRETTDRVSATCQANLLQHLLPLLTVPEQALVRQARNLPVETGKRSNQAVHRQATAFEALIGGLYVTHSDRLQELLKILEPLLFS
jgi:ribonuclease III family protein